MSIELRPIRVEHHGTHDCGENWGFMGLHSCFVATYKCPECGTHNVESQCSAWPITRIMCKHCYADLECSLTQHQTRCVLR